MPARERLAVRYLRWLLRHRRLALALLTVATALAIVSATRVEVRFLASDFYDYEGNPAVPILERYYADFGDPGGNVAVLLTAADVFAPEVLAYVERVTTALVPAPHFERIRSLTTASAVHGEDGEIVTGHLLPALPASAEAIRRARLVATGSRLLARRLVSVDGRATVVLAELARTNPSTQESADAAAAVRQALAALPPPAGVEVHVTGAAVVDAEATRLLLADQTLFVPIAVALILAGAFLLFRTLHGVILLVSAIVVAVIWTFGVYPLFGRPIDMIASTVPATLLVYGAVDPTFLLSRFLGKLRAGESREQAILSSFGELAMPCLLTSITTLLGFASFALLELPTIVTFGKITAVGVALAFVTTMTVLPLLLATLPVPRVEATRGGLQLALERLIGRLAALIARRGRWILGLAALSMVAGAAIGARQTVSVSYTGMLPPGETLDAVKLLERQLSGVTRTVVALEGEPGSMKRPEVLRAIAAIDAVAERHAIVSSSVSLPDLLGEIHQAFMGGEPRAMPPSQALAAQYLAILDPGDRADFVDDDLARSHIRILTEDLGSAAWRPLHADLLAAVDRELAGLGVTAHVTGFAPAIFPVLDHLVLEMLIGFVSGFLIIVLVELVMFRSWRVALLTVFPNLLPAVGAFVLLALFEVTLRGGTVLFLSVSIGGLFNTTIHFAARLLQRLEEGGATDRDAVVEHALQQVLPPSLFTAVLLSLGFAIFLLSRFPDLVVFGMLSGTVLIAGFVADALVTPALFRRFHRWPPPAAADAGAGDLPRRAA